MADMPYAEPAIGEATEHVDYAIEIVNGDISCETGVEVAHPWDKAPSLWLKDYVATQASSSCVYSLEKYLSYGGLSSKYQSHIAAYSIRVEPTSFNEASQDPKWIDAMKGELSTLEENKTWIITPLPLGKKAIGCKCIYKIKYKANGTVERYKARLVAKGYNQKEGLDYQETFSPVGKMVTVRVVISIAAVQDWFIDQMDVHNAFLQGDLYDKACMQIP
uniref:Uncharacterized mitochondrial protein AtMg00820-like n=1 Tax=Nicotiana tabacum TaxID=4097 RepID=A0A1S4A739_TOBAC|nr:PREDICTED: uncharacterized mitochondrial protein AtMg00820-like [Nicotiana tabacum]